MPEFREIWKDVPEYEGLYQASNRGRIRSLPRWAVHRGGIIKGYERLYIGKILSLCNSGAYFIVDLCKDGIKKSRPVHVIVLLTFVGPRPEGMNACHNDGNGKNNNLNNLRWDTRASNEADKIKHGTNNRVGCKGENHWKSKLSNEDIIVIRERMSKVKRPNRCKTMILLASEYGISKQSIMAVVYKTCWGHI